MKISIAIALALVFGIHFGNASCHGRSSDSSGDKKASPSSSNTGNSTEMVSQDKNRPAADNIWGGDHVQLRLRADGASIEFDCAHGEITEPLKPDVDGNFDLQGNFVREKGGPIRMNEPPATRPARYRGRIQNSTMTLTVSFPDSEEEIGTFSLTRGHEGRLWKCR